MVLDVSGQARWIRAHYNFGGMAQELEKTLPREPDEKTLAQGPTRRRLTTFSSAPRPTCGSLTDALLSFSIGSSEQIGSSRFREALSCR